MYSLKKKGTEKPIEIFVALFIILAVSMLMLKMFKSQIDDKQREMEEIQLQSDIEQMLKDAKSTCEGLCSEVTQSQCSSKDMAAFCVRKLQLDLNGDRSTTDYNSEQLGGIAVCEDAVYCPQITQCSCGVQLNMVNCKNVLCKYWRDDQKISLVNSNELLLDTYQPGTCDTDPTYKAKRMWHNIMFDNSTNPLKCT